MLVNNIRYVFERDWNEPLYWKRRNYVQSHPKGLLTCLRIMLLRRAESKKCCTTGLGINGNCCSIEQPLILPHGLFGIVIAHNVRIGSNVTIYQHVTIAEEDKSKITHIGNNVSIGAGAVILNNACIGDNVKIGANAVVTHDIPKNSVVAGIPARKMGG